MSARKQVAARFTAGLDKKQYRVIPAATVTDGPGTRAIVVIEFVYYEPAPNALGNVIAHLRVVVITPKDSIEDAEDDLDNRLPDVLAVLRGIDGATWSRAEKTTVLEKKLPALTLTITVPSTIDAT